MARAGRQDVQTPFSINTAGKYQTARTILTRLGIPPVLQINVLDIALSFRQPAEAPAIWRLLPESWPGMRGVQEDGEFPSE